MRLLFEGYFKSNFVRTWTRRASSVARVVCLFVSALFCSLQMCPAHRFQFLKGPGCGVSTLCVEVKAAPMLASLWMREHEKFVQQCTLDGGSALFRAC